MPFARLVPLGDWEMNRQAVITGIGIVSPLGIGKESFSQRLYKGESGIGTIESFETSRFRSHLGAEIKGFSPRDFVSVKNLRKMDRLSAIAAAASRLALEDAGVKVESSNRDRVGIILGTAFGPTNITAQFVKTLINDGPGFVNPILVPNTVLNAPASHASIELGFRGVNSTVTHYGVSAETAITYAAAEIQKGTADVMLVGGADIISEFFFEALVRFGAVSPVGGGSEGARPFDINRNGPVAGENCGIVCIEPMDMARARGATIYCSVSGWGLGSSPASPTNWPTDPRGLMLTISRALKHAGVRPSEIDAVAACANGGRNPDYIEGKVYEMIFGSRTGSPQIFSIKGSVGESFSSGGINAAVLAMAVKNGKLPPTVGLADPAWPLSFTKMKNLQANVRYALLNGVSFGGTYASIVFKRHNQTGDDV
jgi:3-oxoacyl-[acyl-carrier-protein] synthase II